MSALHTAKLAPWHRRAVIWVGLGLAVTGIVWMAGHAALWANPDLDGSEPRSLLHSVLMAHGVLGYATAVLFGTLLGRHIPVGLARRRKLGSGIPSLALIAALIVSALLLYYAGSEWIRDVASALHQVLGVGAVALVSAHVALPDRRSDGE